MFVVFIYVINMCHHVTHIANIYSYALYYTYIMYMYTIAHVLVKHNYQSFLMCWINTQLQYHVFNPRSCVG